MTFECSSAQAVVQAASIIIGWIVVHKLSVARDLNKARRDMLTKVADAMFDDVSRLLCDALKYHTHTRDSEIESTLKMALQDISSRINLLTVVSNDVRELRLCRTGIINLKKSITGTHFEDEHTTPLLSGADQIQSIAADALRLKEYLQRFKNCQFPVK